MSNYKHQAFLSAIVAFVIIWMAPVSANAATTTNVRVIHASTENRYLDPGLNDIVSELETVFKYTSYRLINSRRMTLDFNQKGQVGLPGDRTLEITPLSSSGDRIKYDIKILKKNRQVFQTGILLKNNGSITIGGPRFNNGSLLFNISGSM